MGNGSVLEIQAAIGFLGGEQRAEHPTGGEGTTQVTDLCRKGRLQLTTWMGTKVQAANGDVGDPVRSGSVPCMGAAIGCQAGEPRAECPIGRCGILSGGGCGTGGGGRGAGVAEGAG